MSKAWGGAGAWALDAEAAEAEEQQGAAELPVNPLLAGESAQSFPSLKESAAIKPKKKKPVPVSLAQFNAANFGREPALESKGLTPEEMLRLPTGPRQRSQEELEYGRLGGGFRSYGPIGGGSRGGGYPGRGSDDGDGSWSGGGGARRGYGGFDEEPRRGPPSRASDFDQPSRADEVENWGAGKKTLAPSRSGPGLFDRYGSLGSGSSSRADEVDNWGSAKKAPPSRYSSIGPGYGDSRAASDSDRWVRGRVVGPSPNNGQRPKIILDPPKRDAGVLSETARTRPSPFGAARPREEVLAEKGVDWKKMDTEIEGKRTSLPTSSQSSRPSSAQSSRPDSPGLQNVGAPTKVAPNPRSKVNPFGDAKPREIVLQEKGMNWRKIDLELEHRSVDRPETHEEKFLKDDIMNLKALVEESEGDRNGRSSQLTAEELDKLHEEIAIKERDLELMILQLDDKVKFGQKTSSSIRPGSGAARSDTSSTRPPSQSGISEESRNIEFIDRPQSLGGPGDVWSRPVDDKHGFHGGRDRSFFDSRNLDRSSSRERW